MDTHRQFLPANRTDVAPAAVRPQAAPPQVPRVSVEFGARKVLAPGDETDPTKRPSDYVGGTFTWHF